MDTPARDTGNQSGEPKGRFTLSQKQTRALGAALLLAFAVSVVAILLGLPLQLLPWIGLAVAAGASLAAFVGLIWPKATLSQSLGAGAVCTGLIAALLAVPILQNPEESATGGFASPSSTIPASSPTVSSPSPSQSASVSGPEPLTWDLDLTNPSCEGFFVDNSLLESLPPADELDAKWAYEHGGATANNIAILTVQGESDDAVVLKGVRVVDLERSPAPSPSKTSIVHPCPGGGAGLDRRCYDLLLDPQPSLTPKECEGEMPGGPVPAKDFPFKVSNSDPEVLEFDIVPGQPCLCAWKIALDWTSRGRSGTMTIDRGFSGIRSVVTQTQTYWLSQQNDTKYPYHCQMQDGTWAPPLTSKKREPAYC
jgi:hypothetical protein